MSFKGKEVVAVSVEPGEAVEPGDVGLLLSISNGRLPTVGEWDCPLTWPRVTSPVWFFGGTDGGEDSEPACFGGTIEMDSLLVER